MVVGTRPELIKVAPLYTLFKAERLEPILVLTNQQQSMVTELLPWFGIDDAVSLKAPTEDSLAGKFWQICKELTKFFEEKAESEWVFAQGDTTTVAASAITTFYSGKKFAHVEAGLRCDTPWLPYPEEGNRRIVSEIAHLNFCPTQSAADNLSKSGTSLPNTVLVGNTGIDALLNSASKLQESPIQKHFQTTDTTKKILITLHRRESFGEPMREACAAIRHIATKCDVEILWPVHSNPSVSDVIRREFSDFPNVKLVSPLDYPQMVSAMTQCDFILTDSGGIQEEAPALGKPVLVLRNETERMELIEAGGGILVGTAFDSIVNNATRLISDQEFFDSMILDFSPFGRGDSSRKIFDFYIHHQH